MVFSSYAFLAVFLPAFLIVYNIIPAGMIRKKNLTLLAFSLFFYYAGEPIWVFVLIFSGLLDYNIGLHMEHAKSKTQAKALLGLSLCGNLGLLLVFKYGAFALGLLGIEVTFAPSLPVGISFYTFQTMSYTIDLYKGQTETQRDPVAFMSYVTMFPQLVAGPIVRYSDVRDRLTSRRVTAQGFSSGVTRFAAGLGKKVIFANHAGMVAEQMLEVHADQMSTAGVWLGAVMFMFQIYFDFSGYSDMAIGLGKMIGFEFKENFDHPYTAKSITDFWRRWHISLSSFFRDYVYIPMGGNRRRQMFNMMVVWGITGLWHGASVNFILWGLYYGIVLIIEKTLLSRILQKCPALLARIYSLLLILFGWIIFYFTDLSALASACAAFFGFSERLTTHRTNELFLNNLWILIVFALFSTSIPSKLFEWLKSRIPAIEPAYTFITLCASFMLLAGQTFNPFIYFRF